MVAYIIVVNPADGPSKVSQEGYGTLEAAQRFIESRSGNPQKINNFRYWTLDGTEYLIQSVAIKQNRTDGALDRATWVAEFREDGEPYWSEEWGRVYSCPHCGAWVVGDGESVDYEFCPYCGKEVAEERPLSALERAREIFSDK